MLRELNSLITIPLVLPTGEILTRPGYHPETKSLMTFDPDLYDVPEAPTRDEVVTALRQLWKPWSAFPFATPLDQSCMLAGVLSAVARPALTTGPLMVFDAPVQGSGKTIAATALGALILGHRPHLSIGVNLGNTEEVRKLITTTCAEGETVLILDNLTGPVRSSAIEGLTTSAAIKERKLGTSTTIRAEWHGHCFLTLNNAQLSKDMARRCLIVRIDPKHEKPQQLEYPFCPVDQTLTCRLAILRGIYTVFAGFHTAGSPQIKAGSCGGFGDWAALIRNCVLWLRQEGIDVEAGLQPLPDPAAPLLGLNGAVDEDTEAWGMVLHGLAGVFPGTEPFTAKDVERLLAAASHAQSEHLEAIKDGLSHFHPKGSITAFWLSHVFRNRLDRRTTGLRLTSVPGPKNTRLYMVAPG